MSLLSNAIKAAVVSALGARLARGRSPIVAALLMLLVSRAFKNRTDEGRAEDPKGVGPADGGGGLSDLTEKFRRGGLEELIKSWIGVGPNKPISPQQLYQALGPETVTQLEQESGLPREDLLTQLSRTLPRVVDELKPGGALPNDEDLVPESERTR